MVVSRQSRGGRQGRHFGSSVRSSCQQPSARAGPYACPDSMPDGRGLYDQRKWASRAASRRHTGIGPAPAATSCRGADSHRQARERPTSRAEIRPAEPFTGCNPGLLVVTPGSSSGRSAAWAALRFVRVVVRRTPLRPPPRPCASIHPDAAGPSTNFRAQPLVFQVCGPCHHGKTQHRENGEDCRDDEHEGQSENRNTQTSGQTAER